MTHAPRQLLGIAPVVFSLSLVACASPSPAPEAKQAQTAAADKLEPYECGTVKRIHVLGGVFLASQPQPEDFEHAKDGGIKTVVNLRHAEEVPFDEAKVVTDLGMSYESVPFKKIEELTDEVFDRARGLMNDPARQPMMVHCSSANRVGAVWFAHRVLDGGISEDAALAEARRVGLKMPAYEARAREYVATKRD
jgi:protein tyrosine phosphatase (PTP) superfamily phosphohydrolase (DUF442 family)